MPDASTSWGDVAGSFWPSGFDFNASHFGGPGIIQNGLDGFPDRRKEEDSEEEEEGEAEAEPEQNHQQQDYLANAVDDSAGVGRPFSIDPTGDADHDGTHALSPNNGNVATARTLPTLAGTVIYWNVQEAATKISPPIYTVRVKPDKGDFIVVYKDLASVSKSITSKLKAGVENMNSKVRLSAKDVIGTVRPGVTKDDPHNRSGRGLHVTFVKTQHYKDFARSTKKDNFRTFGSRNPSSFFINPCGAGSPVRCR